MRPPPWLLAVIGVIVGATLFGAAVAFARMFLA
jgi:hypothetical protein